MEHVGWLRIWRCHFFGDKRDWKLDRRQNLSAGESVGVEDHRIMHVISARDQRFNKIKIKKRRLVFLVATKTLNEG